MFGRIHDNIDRQIKAFALLASLLDEEFDLLAQHMAEEVTVLELSVHDLMRQIAIERTEMQSVMQGTRLTHFAQALPEEEGSLLIEMLKKLDGLEQLCARKASANSRLALALLDQSQEMLDFIHTRLLPKQKLTYGHKGGYASHRPEAAIFQGRL